MERSVNSKMERIRTQSTNRKRLGVCNQMINSEKINYVHCVFQELETLGISLPMGDYDLMYSYLEEIRELFYLEEVK